MSTSQVDLAMREPPRVTAAHVFFLGHATGHELDCLSQWFPSSFVETDAESGKADGCSKTDPPSPPVKFASAEHFMMYSKAKVMGDDSTATAILRPEVTPGQAKQLGRQVKPYDGQRWAAVCDSVVERGNLLKFRQNSDLARRLLDTGNRVLVEANPEDRIWGVGFDVLTAESKESEWGENKLGKALMQVRGCLNDLSLEP